MNRSLVISLVAVTAMALLSAPAQAQTRIGPADEIIMYDQGVRYAPAGWCRRDATLLSKERIVTKSGPPRSRWQLHHRTQDDTHTIKLRRQRLTPFILWGRSGPVVRYHPCKAPWRTVLRATLR